MATSRNSGNLLKSLQLCMSDLVFISNAQIDSYTQNNIIVVVRVGCKRALASCQGVERTTQLVPLGGSWTSEMYLLLVELRISLLRRSVIMCLNHHTSWSKIFHRTRTMLNVHSFDIIYNVLYILAIIPQSLRFDFIIFRKLIVTFLTQSHTLSTLFI